MVLGIDEVGRGPWAGPLVVGAVVLGDAIEGLDDSKKLLKKRREVLESEIMQHAKAVGLGWVSANEIDTLGLSQALRLATVRAVKEVDESGVSYSEIIIDGTVNFLSDTPKGSYVATIPKADGLIPAVSAASIVAKVARDRFMEEQDAVYPGYSFASHAGYGTAKHRAAIEQLGVTPLHRLSFGPLKKYAPDMHDKEGTVDIKMTTTSIGADGERAVAMYLIERGHTIIERNWKTRFCEIDVISLHDGVIYFTEVKTRKNTHHGDGFDAITPKKMQQMRFAAESYSTGLEVTQDISLAAASVVSAHSSIEWRVIES